MRRLRRPAAALVLGGLMLLPVGCGSDNENAARGIPSVPTLSVPQQTGLTTPTVEEHNYKPPTTTESADTTTEAASAETEPVTTEQRTSRHHRADNPHHDSAPPPDSSAARYEQFCNENPGACGN